MNLDNATPHLSEATRAKWMARIIAFSKAVYQIIKTTTPTQRPHLFSAVWFFICAWLAIEIYAIDPDMTLWNVVGYSVVASLLYALLGACFGPTILQMPMDNMALFKAGFLGLLVGLLFTLIVIFLVPMFLLLTHALPIPSSQQSEQLLFLYGVVVPFAFTCLPAIVVGILTTVLLRVFHFKWMNRLCAEGQQPS